MQNLFKKLVEILGVKKNKEIAHELVELARLKQNLVVMKMGR